MCLNVFDHEPSFYSLLSCLCSASKKHNKMKRFSAYVAHRHEADVANGCQCPCKFCISGLEERRFAILFRLILKIYCAFTTSNSEAGLNKTFSSLQKFLVIKSKSIEQTRLCFLQIQIRFTYQYFTAVEDLNSGHIYYGVKGIQVIGR